MIILSANDEVAGLLISAKFFAGRNAGGKSNILSIMVEDARLVPLVQSCFETEKARVASHD